jgi:hypothetical protein
MSKNREQIDNLGSPNDEIRFSAIMMISNTIVKSLRQKEGIYCDPEGIIPTLKYIFDGKNSFQGMTYDNMLQITFNKVLQIFESVLQSLQLREPNEYLHMVTQCADRRIENNQLYAELVDRSRMFLFYSIKAYFTYVRSFIEDKEKKKEENKEAVRAQSTLAVPVTVVNIDIKLKSIPSVVFTLSPFRELTEEEIKIAERRRKGKTRKRIQKIHL